jgi:hypothetical protein
MTSTKIGIIRSLFSMYHRLKRLPCIEKDRDQKRAELLQRSKRESAKGRTRRNIPRTE